MNQTYRSSRIKRALLLAILAGTVVVAAGCSQPDQATEPGAESGQQTSIPEVKTAAVAKQPMGAPAEVVADIAPSIMMDIVAKGGGDVVSVQKRRGEQVRRGEVIARTDVARIESQKQRAEQALQSAQKLLASSRETKRADMAEARLSITKLEAQVEEQTKALNKLKNGYDEGTVEKTAVEQAEVQLKNTNLDLQVLKIKLDTAESVQSEVTAEDQIAAAQYQLKEANLAMEEAEIKSPADGILTEWEALAGMNVAPGTKLGRVANIRTVRVQAKLAEDMLPLVHGKKTLDFYVSGSREKIFKGTITYLSSVMDMDTRTYAIELKADNSKLELKPGMKVQLSLAGEKEREVPVVPANAVVRDEGATFVFIYKDGAAVKRPVRLGPLEEALYAVTDGLREGESIIVSGQHQLQDKQQVRLAQ